MMLFDIDVMSTSQDPLPDQLDDGISLVKVPSGTLRILEDLSPGDEGEETEDAVGRFVWPTALPLLRHLSQQQEAEGKPLVVIELGSGCGVLGMGLAASSTIKHVLLTDHDSDWLQKNMDLNRPTISCPMEVARLDWRSQGDIAAVQDRTQDLLAYYSAELWIVASDVVYNHETHQVLAESLQALCTQHGARITIGFPDRDNDDEEHFLSVLRKVFFTPSISASVLPREYKPTPRKGKEKHRLDLRIIDFKSPNST